MRAKPETRKWVVYKALSRTLQKHCTLEKARAQIRARDRGPRESSNQNKTSQAEKKSLFNRFGHRSWQIVGERAERPGRRQEQPHGKGDINALLQFDSGPSLIVVVEVVVVGGGGGGGEEEEEAEKEKNNKKKMKSNANKNDKKEIWCC